MFYVLIFISLILIFTGMYIDRKKIIDYLFLKLSKIRNEEDIDKMQEKIKELEEKLEETEKTEENLESIDKEDIDEVVFEELPFTDIEIDPNIEIETKEEGFEQVFEQTLGNREEISLHNKVKMIYEYEKKGKKIDEISELMDMKKGEILLLKKLYKES